MDAAGKGTPQIGLKQVYVAAQEAKGDWLILWRVQNLNSEPLDLHAVRLPHGQFKSAERRFSPPIHLLPYESGEFEVSVRCDEPVGPVTENGFLIFQAVRLGEPWRIFARVRVIVSTSGTPAATKESITTQRVGFSGVVS